ncbi:hypothetical protein CSUI_003933 [Cystoisospora suis]|uniref:SWIM-type domain-containing protein n=1 Tax=Cystoisospora suis TaxID=483139 RepID=A0A2C6L2E4_9APIC|nr:hypothetical protein CSUI_003933 [Cystoisospora suis]
MLSNGPEEHSGEGKHLPSSFLEENNKNPSDPLDHDIQRRSTDYDQCPEVEDAGAGHTLVEILLAIKHAKSAGEDLSDYFHLLDTLLPPELLREAVRCMERGEVTVWSCQGTDAKFYLVRDHSRAQNSRTSSSRNQDCPKNGYLVMQRFCSCRTFQQGVLESDSDLTCIHEIAVHLAEALDCVKEQRVVSPEDFAQCLTAASADTHQLRRSFASNS